MDKKKKKSVLEWFMIVMFAISVLCVVLQVVSRRVFNNSLTWCNEVSRYSFLWVVFIGTAVMLKEDGHIAIDVVLTSVPPKFRNVLLVVNYFLITLLMALLTYLGIVLFIKTSGSLSSALRLPINIILYMAMPIGMGMGFFIMAKKTFNQVKLILRKSTDPAVEETREEEK